MEDDPRSKTLQEPTNVTAAQLRLIPLDRGGIGDCLAKSAIRSRTHCNEGSGSENARLAFCESHKITRAELVVIGPWVISCSDIKCGPRRGVRTELSVSLGEHVLACVVRVGEAQAARAHLAKRNERCVSAHESR